MNSKHDSAVHGHTLDKSGMCPSPRNLDIHIDNQRQAERVAIKPVSLDLANLKTGNNNDYQPCDRARRNSSGLKPREQEGPCRL